MDNKIKLCSRCKKRIAVVFLSKVENGESKSEGICLQCARELGIKPIDDMMKNMGITDEVLDAIDGELESYADSLPEEENGDNDNGSEDELKDGRAPAFDLRKMLNFLNRGAEGETQKDGENADRTAGDDRGSSKKEKKAPKNKTALESYCLDLTGKAAEGRIDRVIGREKELERLMQILCRRQKNNPCLIGEPGVGKTAIAEALALRIVAGNVPYKLKGKEVYQLDFTSLVAGTQFRGQFEQRMKSLIDEIKRRGNVILVIDEVHSLVGAGEAEGSMNAGNILKAPLSRGEVQVIGATTLKEYRKYIEKDSALERRFQPILVEESTIEDSVEILNGVKKYYEDYHGIKISSDLIRKIVLLSERYITERFLPDKAIDLLDETASYVALHSKVIDRFNEINDELSALKDEREALEGAEAKDEKESEKTYERLADIKIREIRLNDELDSIRSERENVEMQFSDVAKVLEIWTGIPSSSITIREYEKLLGLEDELKKRIVGQDSAVSSVVRAIKRSRAGISYKKKPISFIFAGPTGVGKTELVKTLAGALFDSQDNIIRVDMSEFMEKHTVSRLLGAPPGYVGYDEAGQLTEKVRRRPYSVVLFDEIEKAHADVLNVLLQILDDGIVTDAQGRKVNFANTVIVMTTNAGSDVRGNSVGFDRSLDDMAADRTMKALEGFLRPEFINRIDEIVVFRSLDVKDFGGIVRIMMNDLRSVIEDKGITFEYTDKAVSLIAESSYDKRFGARNIRRFIQKNVEDEIANRLIDNYKESASKIVVDAKNGKIKIDIK